MDLARRSDHLDALPVRLMLGGSQAQAIATWVESIVGWQAVDGTAGALVPPVIAIADVAASLDAPGFGLPTVLLVAEEDLPADAARAALVADAMVSWPADRGELVAEARRISQPESGRRALPSMRVAGAAGGVGTTTVALALGGLAAWRGLPTLVLTHGHVPFASDVLPLDPADLVGPRIWESATPLPGVRGLRALRLPHPVPEDRVDASRARLVIRDVGPSIEADVLVVRRDRAGLDALTASAAGVVVLVDTGVVPAGAIQSGAAGRPVVTVPWSVRVGRAGVRRRVPADLPGRWLAALDPVLAGERR